MFELLNELMILQKTKHETWTSLHARLIARGEIQGNTVNRRKIQGRGVKVKTFSTNGREASTSLGNLKTS